MKLSVVVPVHNGGRDFLRCLTAMKNADRSPDEIIVVDDVSTDYSARFARGLGANVTSLTGAPHGPAVARNYGANLAQGDILVFVDADVMVHKDTLVLIEQTFAANPEVAALFGSYDAFPPQKGLVSTYKNLQHHYVHQHSNREASSFWAGCGAIRRDIFLKIGGFSEKYQRPSIEDIELGLRLKHNGYRIWLCGDIQVSHLKRWTISSLLRTDIFARAVPWTQLILSSSHIPSDLNLDPKSRLSALIVWTGLFLFVIGFRLPIIWGGVVACIVALVLLNKGLYQLFITKRGFAFCAGAILLHCLYYVYSSLVFAILLLQSRIRNLVGHVVPEFHSTSY